MIAADKVVEEVVGQVADTVADMIVDMAVDKAADIIAVVADKTAEAVDSFPADKADSQNFHQVADIKIAVVMVAVEDMVDYKDY